MDCCSKISKYLLFLTNFCIFCLGAMIMGFSIWALVDGDSFIDLLELTDDDVVLYIYSTASYLLIAASVLVMIISFFGCCGAYKESKLMLTIYMLLLLAIFACFIAGTVLAWDTDILGKIEDPLYKSLENYKPDATSDSDVAIKESWNIVMDDFNCCGVEGYEDWAANNTYYGPETMVYVPPVCCTNIPNMNDTELIRCQMNPKEFENFDQMDGCLDKLLTQIEENQAYVFYTCIVILTFMAINFGFAFAVCCS